MPSKESAKKITAKKKAPNFLLPTSALPAGKPAITTQKASGKTLDILKKAGISATVSVAVADTKSADANMKNMLKGFAKTIRQEAKAVKKCVEGKRVRKAHVHA